MEETVDWGTADEFNTASTVDTEEAVVEQPVVEQPIVDETTAEQPIVDETTVEQPIVDETTVEQPVATEDTTDWDAADSYNKDNDPVYTPETEVIEDPVAKTDTLVPTTDANGVPVLDWESKVKGQQEKERIAKLGEDMSDTVDTIESLRTTLSDNLGFGDKAKANVEKSRSDIRKVLKQKYDIDVVDIEVADGHGGTRTERRFKTADGKLVPYTSSMFRSIVKAKYETVGSTVGALYGAKKFAGWVPGKGKLSLLAKGVLGAIGGTLGGVGLGSVGSAADMMVNAIDADLELEYDQVVDRMTKVAAQDAVLGWTGGVLTKVAGRLLGSGKSKAVKYLKETLGISDKEAAEIFTQYKADYRQGLKAIQEKMYSLVHSGGPQGLAFMKKAVSEDSPAGREAAKAFMKQTSERVDAVLEKTIDSNPALYDIVFASRKISNKNTSYINWNDVHKKVETAVRKGKLKLTEQEANMIDGLQANFADIDSKVFKAADNRAVETHTGSGNTFHTNPTDALKSAGSRSILKTAIDYLTPELRMNSTIVDAIQAQMLKSNDPYATLTKLAKGKGKLGRVATALKRTIPKVMNKAGMGNQPTPTGNVGRTPTGGSTDIGYSSFKKEVVEVPKPKATITAKDKVDKVFEKESSDYIIKMNKIADKAKRAEAKATATALEKADARKAITIAEQNIKQAEEELAKSRQGGLKLGINEPGSAKSQIDGGSSVQEPIVFSKAKEEVKASGGNLGLNSSGNASNVVGGPNQPIPLGGKKDLITLEPDTSGGLKITKPTKKITTTGGSGDPSALSLGIQPQKDTAESVVEGQLKPKQAGETGIDIAEDSILRKGPNTREVKLSKADQQMIDEQRVIIDSPQGARGAGGDLKQEAHRKLRTLAIKKAFKSKKNKDILAGYEASGSKSFGDFLAKKSTKEEYGLTANHIMDYYRVNPGGKDGIPAKVIKLYNIGE